LKIFPGLYDIRDAVHRDLCLKPPGKGREGNGRHRKKEERAGGKRREEEEEDEHTTTLPLKFC